MTAVAAPALAGPRSSVNTRLIAVFLVGAVTAVALGVYGKRHTPSGELPYDLFFSGTIQLKVWFATLCLALGGVQLLLAARLYGKVHVPATAPPWLGSAHRLVGLAAFVISLPVAYHCLWALGFQSGSGRVVAHSLLGCVFYGAFVVKVLGVQVRGMPSWFLPVVGGLVFAALVGLFLTSSVWFFTSGSAGRPVF